MTSITLRTCIAAAVFCGMLPAPLAQAADIPSYKAPSYSQPSYRSWSGLYVGINGGYGFGSSTWDVPAVSNSPSGALIGATIGYNFQYSTWLFGIEGDWDYSMMKDSVACGGGTCETKNSWLGTARGRVGYAFDSFLPYVTAGAAMGNIKATRSTTGSASDTNIGFAVGLGVEYALWSSWTAKLEYLYVDLGKFNCGLQCGATTDNVSFNTNIVRVGLNYRF